MFKTTVKYTDFLGAEREETLRFNLNEQELLDLTCCDRAGVCLTDQQEVRVSVIVQVQKPFLLFDIGERFVYANSCNPSF